jgi:hypothetical protein
MDTTCLYSLQPTFQNISPDVAILRHQINAHIVRNMAIFNFITLNQ